MLVNNWVPIQYRDFHDVPRLIALARGGQWFLLDSSFSDTKDEYEDFYRVLRVREADVALLSTPDWRDIVARAEVMGTVPVAEVEFDQTKREAMRASVLDGLEGGQPGE